MRKHISWMLLVICILAGVLLTGCGSNNSDKQSSGTAQNTETEQKSSEKENSDEAETTAAVTEAAATEASEQDSTEETSKVLVVYYSATGNTKAVANYISPIKGGYGAVRDVIEYLLRENNLWDEAVSGVYGIGV